MYCSSSGVTAVASDISRGWVRSHCAAGLAHMSTAQGWVRSRVRDGCGAGGMPTLHVCARVAAHGAGRSRRPSSALGRATQGRT